VTEALDIEAGLLNTVVTTHISIMLHTHISIVDDFLMVL
jgi:hypothetical protein